MTRIDDLPADRRAVLELLVRHGKSYDELATMLRIEPEKVRERARDALERDRLERQPQLGLVGLLVVTAALFLLGVAFGGAESSLLVLGPLTTFSLPVIAMIALWWEDWPGSSLRGGWAGLVDTVIIVVGAIVLTGLGQIVVGHLDIKGIFETDPGADHLATYPATLPVAAIAFTCMIHLTFVWEGWPLRPLGRFRSGAAALTISWIVAIV